MIHNISGSAFRTSRRKQIEEFQLQQQTGAKKCLKRNSQSYEYHERSKDKIHHKIYFNSELSARVACGLC